MSTYKISYTVENWYTVEVEADSEEEAHDRFWYGEFDDSTEKLTGVEIQDSIEIEEIA